MSDILKIPLKLLLKTTDHFEGDVYIKIGEKVLKLTQNDPDLMDVLNKYQQKGLQDVYVNKDIFEKFVARLKHKMAASQIFDKPNASAEEKVQNLAEVHDIVKEHFLKIGFTEDTLDMAQEIATTALATAHEDKNLFKLLQEFQNRAAGEFLKMMYTNFVIASMLDSFPWRTNAIKEKSALATYLCDIFLEPEDYASIKAYNPHVKDLPERAMKHGEKAAKLLADKKFEKIIPKEVLQIIEQHHEKPDGTGFPKGLRHHALTILTSIHIVAYDFVDLMMEYNFDFDRRVEIVQELERRYHVGHFVKALESLLPILQLKKN